MWSENGGKTVGNILGKWENMGKHGKNGENGGKLFGKLFSALKWTQVEDS